MQQSFGGISWLEAADIGRQSRASPDDGPVTTVSAERAEVPIGVSSPFFVPSSSRLRPASGAQAVSAASHQPRATRKRMDVGASGSAAHRSGHMRITPSCVPACLEMRAGGCGVFGDANGCGVFEDAGEAGAVCTPFPPWPNAVLPSPRLQVAGSR
jgi:hypothetical protein